MANPIPLSPTYWLLRKALGLGAETAHAVGGDRALGRSLSSRRNRALSGLPAGNSFRQRVNVMGDAVGGDLVRMLERRIASADSGLAKPLNRLPLLGSAFTLEHDVPAGNGLYRKVSRPSVLGPLRIAATLGGGMLLWDKMDKMLRARDEKPLPTVRGALLDD